MRLAWRRAANSPNSVSTNQPLADDLFGMLSSCSDLAELMLNSHRTALLLRPQLASHLEPTDLLAARRSFLDAARLVSAGPVRLDRWLIDNDQPSATNRAFDSVVVAPVFLDQLVVTNRSFQAFVQQSGYAQSSLWHASAWPRVEEFVDATGRAGPRFWSDGRPPAGTEDHPLVGVSWFEAEAYARWAGKRLPSDAEWVRAAACPMETGGGLLQRKYPWGDAFDRRNANFWGSGLGRTTEASDYAAGDSAIGVRQLVGNVWEWTTSDVRFWAGDREVESQQPFKSVRGGAFDTYFETQVTCQLRSGDSPLARKHNIGFRCAVNACDLIDEISA